MRTLMHVATVLLLLVAACGDDGNTTTQEQGAEDDTNVASSNSMADVGVVGVDVARDTGVAEPEDTTLSSNDASANPFDESLARILAGLEVPQVPLEPIAARSPELIALGQALFFDPVLSGNKDVACASCHFPTVGASDGLSLSVGTGAQGIGPERATGDFPGFIARHAIDLFNRGDARWTTMFWDSRVALEDGVWMTPLGDLMPEGVDGVLSAQALFPLLDRAEMRGQPGDHAVDGTENELGALSDDDPSAVFEAILERLRVLPGYVALFAAAYPEVEPLNWTIAQVSNAIAAYEAKAFAATNTPWDQYLRGDLEALSDEAKIGASVFFANVGAGCGNCHSGPLLSDQKTHVTGVPQLGPGFSSDDSLDRGRERITGDPSDRFAFRTPPLRNVELSAPYMHNGSILTLGEAVDHYAHPDETARDYDGSNLHPELQGSVVKDPEHIADLVERLSTEMPRGIGSSFGLSNVEDFLRALTDPSAQELAAEIPEAVPSGLMVPGG